MTYKQLFRVLPPYEFIIDLIKCYPVKNIDDTRPFTKQDLIKFGTCEKLMDLLPDMLLYYTPCKHVSTLKEINDYKCITILKHHLLLTDFILDIKEKIINNKKIKLYSIIKSFPKKIVINSKGVFLFD